MSRYQCGGIEGRSITDHLLTLNAVIDYNKHLGAPTYVWFGDAVKCFDRLNLADCVKELGRMTGWEEAALIYDMNKKGKAIIETPVGTTREIEIKEKVKQGTIFGPKLCSIVTDKVNTIGRKSITLLRDIEIESLIYVDDIMFPCSRVEGIETAIDNCHSMEVMKNFTFSTKPEKSGILVIGNRKEEIQISGKVKNGDIQRVSEYKYLGEWYTEKDEHKVSIQKRKEKVGFMIHEILKYGNVGKVGDMALEVRLKIYETVVVPTIFANIETWGTIKERDIKELEGIQYKIMKAMFEQVSTTPYWGLLAETGIWPVKSRIEYKKIMLYHNIITSDSKRLVKDIVEDQIRSPYKDCWGMSIKEICEKYQIEMGEIKQYSKQILKKLIKTKITKEIVERIEEKKLDMTKLRFTNGTGRKEYIERLKTKEAIMIMKMRLNMIEVKCNYKSKFTNLNCELCGKEDDTTEHLFECKELERLKEGTIRIEDMENPTREMAKYIKRVMEFRKIVCGSS